METAIIALTLLNVVLWSGVLNEVRTGGIERMNLKFLKMQRDNFLNSAYYKAVSEHQENFMARVARITHRKMVAY